jgi:hypothetical protein
MPLSYSDVFNLVHERDHPEEIAAGDLVRMGQNHFPHYAVVAVNGETAWVRNVQSGEDCLARLDRCRKVEGEAAARAA